jgi:CubicO group peptidase (beta-lactamase class C family)
MQPERSPHHNTGGRRPAGKRVPLRFVACASGPAIAVDARMPRLVHPIMPRLLTLLAPLLALLSLTAMPVAARADAIDDIVDAEARRQFSPGVAYSVVKGGKVLKAKGYGLANVEHHVHVNASTSFQTASVGKQFTAALVMLLARDGKLKLDEPVSAHLPDAPAAWQGITVRHLLTHTSGLVRADDNIDMRKDYSEGELLASAYKLPLQSAPGSQHDYSNLGYQVLGILCSRVGGRFYGDQMHDRLFEPLGMKARIISERDIIPGRASGYVRVDGVLENQAWVSPSLNTTADGSLYVSAEDMARWSLMLDGQRLLSTAEKEAMWTPATLSDGQRVDYGFGWRLATEAGHRQVRHRGDWQGFTSHLLHMPDDRLTISVLMNRAYGQPHVIADRIAATFIPALRKVAPVPPGTDVLARTPLFVRGSMNGWKDSAPLSAIEPGLLQARLALAAGMQQFKLGDAEWKVADFGARFDEAVVKPGRSQPLEFRGEDLFLELREAGEFLFQLDLRSKQGPVLTVLPAPAPAPAPAPTPTPTPTPTPPRP